ncbi:MAG: DinB family protein [Acidobacteria bacterium]|nr:DinB family protein [Acidobacteriota bacterium]
MLPHVLLKLFNELVDGSAEQAAWVLNPLDPGLMRSLETLSAAQASAVPPGGGASIAAHVDHLRYGLELLNRWSRGEEPFAEADYSASWHLITVSEAEWASRRHALAREAYAWRDALSQPRELDATELAGVVASIVHLAYHLGAMRQIDRAMRGPAAQD